MKNETLIQSVIFDMSDSNYQLLQNSLEKELNFYFIQSCTKTEFAEKLYDYFDKVELNTRNSLFKLMKGYMQNLDSVVKPYVVMNSKVPSRAQKYYQKASTFLKYKELEFQDMIDYTRIMMCLYAAILKNKGEPIINFDFSIDCLDIDHLLTSFKKESKPLIGKSIKRDMFNFKDIYGVDQFSFIVLTMFLYKIKDGMEE